MLLLFYSKLAIQSRTQGHFLVAWIARVMGAKTKTYSWED